MTEQCFGRLQKDGDEYRARFQDSHRFFLEYRCKGRILKEQLCAKCLEWKQRGLKKNDHYRSHHGLITEPIPQWSHIFEGPWYQSKVSVYGHPSESEMARAKQAQQEARKGVTLKPVEVVVPVAEGNAEPKKRGRKKKEAIAPIPAPQPPSPEPIPNPSPPPEPVPPAPKPKTTVTKGKRRPKAAPQSIPLVVNPVVQVQAVETSTLPNELEIVKIVVRPFFHNDVSYFRDASKNKLYAVGKDKRPSSYVGRWDPESETINTDFPDSDAE